MYQKMAPKVSFLDPACSCADITTPTPTPTPSSTTAPSPTCHHHRPNLNEILPGLFLGNLAAAESTEMLTAHGITHILSITSTPPSIPPGYIHKYHHLHDEHSADLLSILPDCVARIEFLLASAPEKRVLVHCCMGRSRSAAVVIGYVMKARACAYEGAFAVVAGQRPMVRPNSGFVGMLRVWGACGASPWVGEEMAEIVARARPRRVVREGSRRRRCLLEEEWVVVEEVGGGECWGVNGAGDGWGGGFLVGFFLGRERG